MTPVDEQPATRAAPPPEAGRQPVATTLPVASALPVAQVAVDSGQNHLDRPFDYAVPASLAEPAQPGCRVRIRFSGRLVDGVLLARTASSEHAGRLAPLVSLVSPEPVLTPEVATLARALADRHAGVLYDVLRLALPPRHARVEREAPGDPSPTPPAPEDGTWSRYPAGPAFLRALAAGRSPRAVWAALPGPTWPDELATAVRATAASGRGAVVVVPDVHDLDRVSHALAGVPHAVLRADLGPAERYRRWLRVRRGEVRVAVGTRATAFAPVADLGLVVLWDDGDDLHAEPRSPYVHVRDVLVQRAHLAGAAALVGGFTRTAEGQLLLDMGWAKPLVAPRQQVRRVAPLVEGTSEDDLARDPLARAARLPARAFEVARQALGEGRPVLVQVPRRGYAPSLACARDRTPARCGACSGPLGVAASASVPTCSWCGALAGNWRCSACEGRALRAVMVGARRTAEELGRAFPGRPVLVSGRDGVLATVGGAPALVVATPGAEPVADEGYGAVLLLDSWVLLGRADLRAGEETLRRWAAAAALARPGAPVVIAADRGVPQVQALTRWDPAWAAERELGQRAELGFPPATRMAAIDGSAEALAGVTLDGFELLGPVPLEPGRERLLVRVPRSRGVELARALKELVATRSARKAEPVRVELDPQSLTGRST